MMTGRRVWLLALAIAVIGCGGHVPDDGRPGTDDSGAVDASRDRDSIAESEAGILRDGDGVGIDIAVDAHDGNLVDNGGDRRADVASDARDAAAAPDTRDADALRDGVDATYDGDRAADIHVDAHDVSVGIDAPLGADAADAGDEVPSDGGAWDAADDTPVSDADAGGDGCTPVT